jgi:hypothetical protein
MLRHAGRISEKGCALLSPPAFGACDDTPSPPAEGGEGRGEEALFTPLSAVEPQRHRDTETGKKREKFMILTFEKAHQWGELYALHIYFTVP